MNEFQQYNNSQKITHMLDGELSKGESAKLQKIIDGDPELKSQMDTELKIREAIGRGSDSIKPPFSTTATIFGIIGIDLAILTGASSQTIGFWAKMVSQKAFWPVVTTTVATVVTTLSLWMGGVFTSDLPQEQSSKTEDTKDILLLDKLENSPNNLEVNATFTDTESSLISQNNSISHGNTSAAKGNSSGVDFADNFISPTVSSALESLALTAEKIDNPSVLIQYSKPHLFVSFANFSNPHNNSFIFDRKKSPRISSGLGGNSFAMVLKSEANLTNVALGFSFDAISYSSYNVYFNGIYSFGNIFDGTVFGSTYYGLIGAKFNIAHFEYGVPIAELGFGNSNLGTFGYGGFGVRMFLRDEFLFGLDLNIDIKFETKKLINIGKDVNGGTIGFNIIF